MDRSKEDLDRPNPQSNKEPAEGSRETVAANTSESSEGSAQHAAGITNRPLQREEQEQREVPPRGMSKEEERKDSEAGEHTDVGKTGGGGSSGHDQPDKVRRDTPIRNATGSDRDPVMPHDDATLNTKI